MYKRIRVPGGEIARGSPIVSGGGHNTLYIGQYILNS